MKNNKCLDEDRESSTSRCLFYASISLQMEYTELKIVRVIHHHELKPFCHLGHKSFLVTLEENKKAVR